MFWPREAANRAGSHPPECRTVCLPEVYRKMSAKHGLQYGSTCYERGCRRILGYWYRYKVKAFRFACDENVTYPSLDVAALGVSGAATLNGASAPPRG